MTNYSTLERRIARSLEAVPAVRRMVRDGYYAFSYARHRAADFTYALAPGVSMQSAAEWAGIAPHAGPSFFGYYDKSPFSADGRYLLQHEVEGKLARVVAYDRVQNRRVMLGWTATWNWQQGAQATWMSNDTVGYNTVEGGVLGTAIVTLEGARHFIPLPLQSLLPNGEMLSISYARLSQTTADYGYPVPLPLSDEEGVWKMNILTGQVELILSLATLMALKPLPSMAGAEHYVNHCLPSPNGERYLVLHRWVKSGRMLSRLILGGGEPRILLDEGGVSHCAWRDDSSFITWARADDVAGYHLINIQSGERTLLSLNNYGDGHPTFARDGRLLTDSYPDKSRQQRLFLGDRELGRFLSPWKYRGARRCDLHPRFSADEKMISIDSAHTGERTSYVIGF